MALGLLQDPHPFPTCFFANDIILFAKAKVDETYELIKILNSFTRALDQLVNIQKSGLIFGSKVPANRRRIICEILNIIS